MQKQTSTRLIKGTQPERLGVKLRGVEAIFLAELNFRELNHKRLRVRKGEAYLAHRHMIRNLLDEQEAEPTRPKLTLVMHRQAPCAAP